MGNSSNWEMRECIWRAFCWNACTDGMYSKWPLQCFERSERCWWHHSIKKKKCPLKDCWFWEIQFAEKRRRKTIWKLCYIFFTNAMWPFLTLCPPHTQTWAIFGKTCLKKCDNSSYRSLCDLVCSFKIQIWHWKLYSQYNLIKLCYFV